MIFKYIYYFFVISSFECDVVLFVVLCDIDWFSVLLRSFDSYWKIGYSINQSCGQQHLLVDMTVTKGR